MTRIHKSTLSIHFLIQLLNEQSLYFVQYKIYCTLCNIILRNNIYYLCFMIDITLLHPLYHTTSWKAEDDTQRVRNMYQCIKDENKS